MQRISITETSNALIEIPFTSVSNLNLQTRIPGSTLANAGITVKVKQPGVTTAVSGAGSFVAVDDTNAPGVRGYRPSTGERALGVCTFVFTGSGMEPREVPVIFVSEDPYLTITFGSVIAGTLTTLAFSTDLVPTDTDHWKDCYIKFTTGNNAGVAKKIAGSSGSAGRVVTLSSALPNTPVATDKFRIVNN